MVIIGQDPYHGPNQAHGLSFSVEKDINTPPSLKNIYKEIQSDIGCYIPNHGNLTKWADQGVLMLNAVLTVEAGKPNSHKGKGWEEFTGKVIEIQENRCLVEVTDTGNGNFTIDDKVVVNTDIKDCPQFDIGDIIL